MASPVRCPHCGHPHLLRIRVRGIRTCAACRRFVDVRTMAWWKRWRSA